MAVTPTAAREKREQSGSVFLGAAPPLETARDGGVPSPHRRETGASLPPAGERRGAPRPPFLFPEKPPRAARRAADGGCVMVRPATPRARVERAEQADVAATYRYIPLHTVTHLPRLAPVERAEQVDVAAVVRHGEPEVVGALRGHYITLDYITLHCSTVQYTASQRSSGFCAGVGSMKPLL